MAGRGKPTYVLGTGLSHDGSSCLLRDGKIAVAIEKERLTRRKHDGGNDALTLQYCLDAEGITIDDVDVVVQNANFSMLERGSDWWEGRRPMEESTTVVTISHHLAHAYSGLGCCPFDEAAVLVVDGCGNAYDECLDLDGEVSEPPAAGLEHLFFEKDSYYAASNGQLGTLYKDFSPWGFGQRDYPLHPQTTRDSIGGLYGAASVYSVFGMDDPGKLMGLAAYGRPGRHDFEIFELREGRVFVRYDWMADFTRPARTPRDLESHFQHYADLAYHVQREVERALLYLLRERRRLHSSPNLIYAGGVALNAVANRRLLDESGFERIFVPPAAADNGLAIGCAYYGWLEALGRERARPCRVTWHGRRYDRQEIEQALSHFDSEIAVATPSDLVESAAELLASGQVVGWFQGRSELGPRALGHRSILADPAAEGIRDFINREVKFREDYRPFAPAVRAEEASEFFDLDHESPYMLFVAPVRAEFRDRLASVVHRDDSCRLQTVNQKDDPLFHRLLGAFGARSGAGVLLNTSLNWRGMPIVETPQEAVDFLLGSGLDALVLGRHLVTRRAGQDPASCAELESVMADLERSLVRHRQAASAIGGSYEVRIGAEGAEESWAVALSGSPTVRRGGDREADTRLTLEEASWRSMLADPEAATIEFMERGELQFEGDPRGVFSLRSALALRLRGRRRPKR